MNISFSPTPFREDFAADLARFAFELSTSGVAAPVHAAVKTNVFDTLVCAIAGSSAEAVADLRELARQWGGSPQASLFVFGDQLPAHHAAWVKGTMAHARDYDDTHDAAVLHAGVSVVPGALAAAELGGGIPGNDFLAAVAAGLETICRLGVSTTISIIDSGYMYTGLLGHFAATVAAGRALRLDEVQMRNAIGIAYSQVAGNHQVTRDGALTKRMQPGFAAMSALLSVQLVRRGTRGVQQTFEGADGLFQVYLRDRVDTARLRGGLGSHFHFVDLSYKPYPCCRFNHMAIDATLELRNRLPLQPERIRKVRVGVNRQAFEAGCTPVDVCAAPRTIVHAQFSIPFTVACALVYGFVGMGHFSDDAFQRQDILALAQKVEGHVDADVERAWGRNISPARVQIDMEDGASHALRVDLALGHPQRPMLTSHFDAKAADGLRFCARPLREDALGQLRSRVDALESLDDVRVIAQALAPVA